jgi:SAM-dependent methyltransferase
MQDDCGAAILDLDAEVLRLATARDPGLPAVQGDLFHLPFRDGVFDLVFNSSTLEHLEPWPVALAEMARVTRPGGRLFVGVPYRWGPFLPFTLVPSRHPVSVWMGRLYGRRELRMTFEACGFRVEEVHLYFFGCFVGALLSCHDDRPTAQPAPQAGRSAA